MARLYPGQMNRLWQILTWMPLLQMYKCCFTEPSAYTELTHFRCYKRLLPWFCLAKGKITYITSSWVLMFCSQSLNYLQVLLECAKVWHLLLALRMLLTCMSSICILCLTDLIKYYKIQLPKYAMLGTKISFHDGTLCLEMLLFIQTSCRHHLFFT